MRKEDEQFAKEFIDIMCKKMDLICSYDLSNTVTNAIIDEGTDTIDILSDLYALSNKVNNAITKNSTNNKYLSILILIKNDLFDLGYEIENELDNLYSF